MKEMPSSETVSTKLERIAKQAQRMRGTPLTSLSHNIDLDWMHEAWRRTRKGGAPGVDGQTAREYEQDLEANLQDLLNRAKSGRYFAPPVRRVHIPKGRGNETRPIGIPTLEDKVLQRAVTMALEAVFEQDFSDCSYGFRPGRSAHDALETLWQGMMDVGQCWIVEVDIRGFFDALDPKRLRTVLDQRVRDGVLRRLIDKWLKAGVQEAGQLSYPETGTPQGGVISPLLANVYLHKVVDTWIERTVAPKLRASVRLVRYADDLVLVFRDEQDARRVFAALPQRFAEWGLTLHPAKTRLVEFRQPPYSGRKRPHVSFDFLGFTHYWGRSQKGGWIVQRKTAADRRSRTLHRLNMWCRNHRHMHLREQHKVLCAKLKGHFNYYGVTGNGRSLRSVRDHARRSWRKWLDRRCWKGYVDWKRFQEIERRFPLPPVRLVRSACRP
jgi:group II intron reverse transcriptase/maturase